MILSVIRIKSAPPAVGLNWSPLPDPITKGIPGIVPTPLKLLIPGKELGTSKGSPVIGITPAFVKALTDIN